MREIGLVLGLGALVLAVRLYAEVPSSGAQLARMTLLGAHSLGPLSCRIEVYVHGGSGGRARLRAPPEICRWRPGQVLVGRIQLAPWRPATNPGQASPRRHQARRGVHRVGTVEEGLLVAAGPTPHGLSATLAHTRRRVAHAVDPPTSPRRAGAVLRALVAGDRSAIPEELRQIFVHTGTVHLLAVSGLHVGWVLLLTHGAVMGLLGRLPSLWLLRRLPGLSLALAISAAGAYAALSGLAVPALRAVATAGVAAVAVLGGRPASAWNALGLAALVVLAVEPAALFSAAFALSFAAVAGILAWRPSGGRIRSLFGVSVGAAVGTAPVLALLGAPLPAGSLLVNLVAVPFFGGVVLPLGLLAGFGALVLPGVAAWIHPLAAGAAELGIRSLESMRSPDLLGSIPDRVRISLAVSATILALRLAQRRLWPATGLLVALALLTLLLPAPQRRSTPRGPAGSLLFLDVGHGDAVIVHGSRSSWLIDTGPRFGSFDAGRLRVIPALRAEGVDELATLVLTHADLDHVGGARAILRELPVHELWLTAATYAAPRLLALRRLAAQRNVTLRLVAAGDRGWLPPFEVRVLWPPRELGIGASNAGSIVLRLEGPAGCALLPADVPSWVERRLAAALAPCELLKLAHHGSRTSTAPSWLESLRPRVAVASAGLRSRAALPHPRVRRQLRDAHVELYETRRHGSVRVRFTPRGLRVELALAEPWLDPPRRAAW